MISYRNFSLGGPGEYDAAKLIKRRLEAELKVKSDVLKAVAEGKRHLSGLVTDECKATEEYKAAKNAYNLAFERFRTFNAAFMKKYKKEMMVEKRGHNGHSSNRYRNNFSRWH